MRFYAAVLVCLVAALVFATQRYRRFHYPDVNVAVVELVGPTDVRPGARARYAAVVHDRAGEPLEGVKVRVGFEHNGFDELATATTGAAGDAILEPRIPRDLREPRLLRVHAESALGHAEDDHWIAPRAPLAPLLGVSTDRVRYDAGETVQVRAELDVGDSPLPEQVTVSLEQRGKTIVEEATKTSSFGIATLGLPLAAELPAGVYDVRVRTSDGRVGKVAIAIAPRAPLRGASGTVMSLRATAYPEGGALVAAAVQTIHVAVTGGDPASRVVRVNDASPVTVSRDGTARVTVTVPATSFELVVTDDAGHRAVEKLTPTSGALALHAEQEVFPSGAPMRVTVFGAASGEHVLLQLSKGEDTILWRSGRVARAEAGCAFELPLPRDLAGVLWLQAMTPDGTRVGRRLVMVSPSPALLVKVSASAEAADIDVIDAASNTPVKAELGLAVGAPDAVAFERTARDLAATLGDDFDRSDVRALTDPTLENERRGVTLARLSALGRPLAPITKRDVYADETERRERLRWRAWVTVGLAFIAFALVAPLLGHGLDLVTLGRRPHEALPRDERDRRWSRLLQASAAWAAAVAVPPVSVMLHDLVARATSSPEPSPDAIAMTWGIAAAVTAFVVMLASARARAFVSPHALVGALAFGHAACVLDRLDGGRALGSLFTIARDRHGLGLVLLLIAQLVFAVLAVVRITTTEPTTLRDRRSRLSRSASLCGLPLTLGLLAWGAYLHVVAANAPWSELVARSEEGARLGEENARRTTRARWASETGASALLVSPQKEIDDPRVRLEPGEEEPLVSLWQPRVTTDDRGHAHVPLELAGAQGTVHLEVKAVARSGRTGVATTELTIAPR